MKQFEKWLNEHFRPVCLSQQSKDKMRITWRGALEYMLAQETVKPLLGGSEHKYIDSIVIRKELKGGD